MTHPEKHELLGQRPGAFVWSYIYLAVLILLALKPCWDVGMEAGGVGETALKHWGKNLFLQLWRSAQPLVMRV